MPSDINSPGKRLQAGYACIKCEEERAEKHKKNGAIWDYPEHREALYKRNEKRVFYYIGKVDCPVHGYQPGVPMQGTKTKTMSKDIPQIEARTSAAGPDTNEERFDRKKWSENADKLLRELHPGEKRLKVPGTNRYINIEEKTPAADATTANAVECTQSPDENAAAKSQADKYHERMRRRELEALASSMDPREQLMALEALIGRYGLTIEGAADRQRLKKQINDECETSIKAIETREACEQRKDLARRAFIQHKLMKAAAGRIYHVVMIDSQEIYKGSTGMIYHYAIVGRQPGANWRAYAWTEDPDGAAREKAILEERFRKQKIDIELQTVEAVNEREI